MADAVAGQIFKLLKVTVLGRCFLHCFHIVVMVVHGLAASPLI
jgi:hypothetical protein